jgi:aminoglycoside phosphotransferase (APT) family kinase protein
MVNMPEDTIAVREGEQLDWARIEDYLRAHIPSIGAGTIAVRQFPAGISNLTYLVRIGGWEGVLRRPPFGPIAPKAHDMQRESNLLRHIHPVFPLAPESYLFCADLDLIGVPFYVMERRRGIILDDTFPSGITPTPELCQRISTSAVDTLVQIHAIDWQTAGLDDFGHPTGFLDRQVKGWTQRYVRAQTDEIPQVEALMQWLVEHTPTSPAATLIHNDFKLNNILMHTQDLAQPVAVLDWEMATIGDPLFDLAITLAYWVQSDDPEELQSLIPTVTTRPGFISRIQFMERYSAQSKRDLSSMHFYMTFAYFKQAVILQQIYVRWKRGQTQDGRFAVFGSHIRTLIQYAAQLAEKGKL